MTKQSLSSSKRIRDYAPVYLATAEVAKGLLPYIDKMPKDYPYEEDDSPEHLKWMVAEIVSNSRYTDYPIDKLSRWLAYIQGILRAHRVLDTVAERDRTRPIFHAAYTAMGIEPPKKRDRDAGASTEPFERPDLAALIHKWSFPFRNDIVASFFRGLTQVFSLHDDYRPAFVTSDYHDAIFGRDCGCLRRIVNVPKQEAEFRFSFFEKFMDGVRSNEMKSLAQARMAHLAGLLVLCALIFADAGASLVAIEAGHPGWAIAANAGLAVFCGLAWAGSRIVRRCHSSEMMHLQNFRKSLPWKEDDISGTDVVDSLHRHYPP